MNFDETMLNRLRQLEREVERLKVKESPGAWIDYVPTITVSGGTAPTYTTTFVTRYCRIGKLCTVYGRWENNSGGTAGAGANPLYITLPFTAYTPNTQAGVAAFVNGATWLGNLGVYMYDTFFGITKADWSEITGAEQNNVERGIQFTFTYEAA